MKADPGRPPEGMSPFQAIVNLYDESQRLAVELERHAEKMVRSSECIGMLMRSEMNSKAIDAMKAVASEAFVVASKEVMIIIDKMRANRAVKCALVERDFR